MPVFPLPDYQNIFLLSLPLTTSSIRLQKVLSGLVQKMFRALLTNAESKISK
jgi:hypothetical protein